MNKPNIYDDLVAAGVEIDNHESDLYCRDCPEAEAVLRRWPNQSRSRFHSRKGGGWWFDLPFAYLPWWQDRVKGYGKA